MPEITPPPLPKPVARWRWWVHLLIIVPYPALLGLLGAGRHESHQAALSTSWPGLLKVCAFEVVVFGLVVAIALGISKASRDDLMLRIRGRQPGLMLALGVGYAVAIRLALGIVLTVIGTVMVLGHLTTWEALQAFVKSHRPDIETVVNLQALRHDPVYLALTLTLVSFVVAGVREELWRSASLTALRKLWPRWFGSRTGEYVAVMVTSLVFGLGHMPQGVIAVGATTLIGIALGSIMVFHRSTWVAVIAHGMFDATSFALIALVADKLPELTR